MTSWTAGHRAAHVSPYDALSYTASRDFRERTLHQAVHLHRGGEAVRILISNLFGHTPLVIGRAAAGPGLPLTFDGSPSLTLPPGETTVSDPVRFAFDDGYVLPVELYVRESDLSSAHPDALRTGWVTSGDTVGRGHDGGEEITSLHWIAGVDVLRDRDPGEPVIVAFGDSLTDGTGTTLDADLRYPDVLSRRLGRTVLNLGIGGNRLLRDGFGQAAVARFDRDVLSVPGLTHVIVEIGINDLGLPAMLGQVKARLAGLVAGYTGLARRTRAAGAVPLAATLPPYAGTAFPGYYSEKGDALRGELNTWIRTTPEFAGVLDLDAALRDPADPSRYDPALGSGDGLHPNDAGAAAIAHAFDPVLLDRKIPL